MRISSLVCILSDSVKQASLTRDTGHVFRVRNRLYSVKVCYHGLSLTIQTKFMSSDSNLLSQYAYIFPKPQTKPYWIFVDKLKSQGLTRKPNILKEFTLLCQAEGLNIRPELYQKHC